MKEDFVQNIQFDLFSVELVIGETATLLMAENYVTIREVFVDDVKVEPNEEKQIFLTGGGDDLWELGVGDILQPKENRTFTIKKASEVNVADGNPDKYLNEQGDMTQVEAGQVKYTPTPMVGSNNVQDAITELGNNKQATLVSGTNIKTINGESILGSGDIEIQGGVNNHKGLTDKNAEPDFQHVDTTTTKETLVRADKVPIYDSVSGKVVLTNKSNVGGGGTYKILDTVVSTLTASTTYTKYPYEAVILIDNLKESDLVEVIYSIPDAESTNYAPGGELYEGYIKIFAKVNTEITIPTLVITKIDL